MGWWQANREGVSFAVNDGPEMVWGDGPADFLDDALDQITDDFRKAYGRPPTCGELRAGLEFSLIGKNDEEPFDKEAWHGD